MQSDEQEIRQLVSILDLYKLDTGHFPKGEEGLKALVVRPADVKRWNGPYVKQQASLTDPWGSAYQYRQPGQHGGPYDLFSLGADQAEGGTGEDADVTSWSQ